MVYFTARRSLRTDFAAWGTDTLTRLSVTPSPFSVTARGARGCCSPTNRPVPIRNDAFSSGAISGWATRAAVAGRLASSTRAYAPSHEPSGTAAPSSVVTHPDAASDNMGSNILQPLNNFCTMYPRNSPSRASFQEGPPHIHRPAAAAYHLGSIFYLCILTIELRGSRSTMG